MVHKEHKHHVILWERADGQAYMSIDPKYLTSQFCQRIKEDVDNEMGFNEFKAILKNEGYDVE